MATTTDEQIPAPAPAAGVNPGRAGSAASTGVIPHAARGVRPGVLGLHPPTASVPGTIVAGGPLSPATLAAVEAVGAKTPARWRRYIAYADKVKVGGSLAWRANNPGNLRGASTKIGSVPGASGHFAVFATLEDGRAAQRALYLSKYGDTTVTKAINALTPPSENDTKKYLSDLKAAGVDLDKDVKSQIDLLMKSVQANEGLIAGREVTRLP